MNDIPTYANLDIAIRKWDGAGYPTHVIDSPAGEAQGVLSFANVAPDVISSLRRLRDLVLTEGSQAPSARDRTRDAKELGELLFDALMSGDIRSCFDVSRSLCPKGLRIRLRIEPPELAMLPWELMGDKRKNLFLALSMHTSLARYFELQQTTALLPIQYPLKIMVVSAAPSDLAAVDSDKEISLISGALSKLVNAGTVKITVLKEANLLMLQKKLREEKFHIFHYIGHGYFSADDGEGFLVFETEEGTSHLVNGRKLGRLLHDEDSMRLVVLNACATGQLATSDSFSGVASALVQAGVPAVLAMQSQISDLAASRFSQVFYESLADGYPIDAAVAQGRLGLDLSLDDTIEWAIPQLFTRSKDGQLFPVSSSDAEREVKPDSDLDQNDEAEGTAVAPEASSVSRVHIASKGSSADALSLHDDDPRMAQVPASEFVFGSGLRTHLPDYYIDRYPVTNGDYWLFVRETGMNPPSSWSKGSFPEDQASHPVTGISWFDATKYAQWTGKRLPSESEWEKAARGQDGRRYPWGNDFDKQRCNTLESGSRGIRGVGSCANDESPFGVRDMIGNTWEWTSDEEKARGLGVQKTKRVVKGGAWNSPGRTVDCTTRSCFFPEDRLDNVGFRCVRSGRG